MNDSSILTDLGVSQIHAYTWKVIRARHVHNFKLIIMSFAKRKAYKYQLKLLKYPMYSLKGKKN